MKSKKFLIHIGLLFLSLVGVGQAAAIITIPNTLMYQGVLYNPSNQPITAPQTIRFSIWSNNTIDGTTFDGGNGINPAGNGYESFVEEHNITPNVRGIFSVQLGNQSTLPLFESTKHQYLQVELKPQGAPDSAYEVLDPSGTVGDGNDRKPIVSAPYASNADRIDNREIGTVEGDLAVLGPNGQWTISQIPGGTNEDTFIIDADGDSPTQVLQFGGSSANFLEFDGLNDWFSFSNDVNFNQNQAINFVLEKGTVFPASPVEGQQFYREDLDSVFVFDGVAWKNLTDDVTAIAGTSSDTFTIDTDNSSTTIALEFGNLAGELLAFDTVLDRFTLSNDLAVNGTIEQSGNTLTLGTANTGTGSNVDIVAAQGADPSGVLRYNATTNEWELSNDGVTFSTIVDEATLNTPKEKQLTLTAEYGGFTLREDGTDNLGTMLSEYIDLGGLDKYLYYRWITRKNTMQDMDIVVKFALPSDFVSFTANPIEVQYRTATAVAAENRIDISVDDSNGDPVPLVGGSGLASTTFSNAALTFGGTPTFTADGMMVVTIKMSTLKDRYADVGDIILHYNGL